MARALSRVDPMIRIAWVTKDPFLLLVPGVHRLPPQGDVFLKPFTSERQHRRICPSGILDYSSIEFQPPVGGKLVMVFGQRMLAWPQQIGAYVGAREEVNGKDLALLPEQKDPFAVGHSDISDFGAYPAWSRLENQRAYPDPGRCSWRVHDSIPCAVAVRVPVRLILHPSTNSTASS